MWLVLGNWICLYICRSVCVPPRERRNERAFSGLVDFVGIFELFKMITKLETKTKPRSHRPRWECIWTSRIKINVAKYFDIIIHKNKGDRMQASFVLDSDELDYNFIDKLKVLFQNKRIELTISESDDTEYLLGSNTNKDILLRSIENIENGKDIIVADPKLFG